MKNQLPAVYNMHNSFSFQLGSYTRVDRGTKWGNPFKITPSRSRQEAIRLYVQYLANADLLDDLHELAGQNLACWCSPLPCHADILLVLAATIGSSESEQK